MTEDAQRQTVEPYGFKKMFITGMAIMVIFLVWVMGYGMFKGMFMTEDDWKEHYIEEQQGTNERYIKKTNGVNVVRFGEPEIFETKSNEPTSVIYPIYTEQGEYYADLNNGEFIIIQVKDNEKDK